MDKATEKYLDTKFEAIDTSIHNNREIFTLRLDKIIADDAKRNGILEDHTDCIEKLQDHARSCKSQRKTVRWVISRWWLIAAAIVVISGATTWGYHHVTVDKIKVGPVEFGVEEEPVRGGEVK